MYLKVALSLKMAGALFCCVLLYLHFVRFLYYKKRTAIVFTVIFCSLLGIGYVRAARFEERLLRIGKQYKEGQRVWIKGTIYDIQKKSNSIYCYVEHGVLGDRKQLKVKTTAGMAGEQLTYPEIINEQVDKCDKILLVLPQKEGQGLPLMIGYQIHAYGSYNNYGTVRNEGGFDERRYYTSLGIQGKFKVTEYSVTGAEGVDGWLRKKPAEWKHRLKGRSEKLSDSGYAQIYCGILLGEKEGIPKDTIQLYQMAGISHILSISGLHISLLGYGLYRWLRRRRGFFCSVLVSTTVIGLYTVMVGNGYATKRAFIMFGLHLAGELAGRSYDLISALSSAFIVLILENPFCMENTGVQLSFGAIAGIAVLYPVVEKYMDLKGKIAGSLAASVCIDTCTRPVIINAYHMLPVYSVFLNLIVVALMGMVMSLGLIGILLSYVWIGGGRGIFLAGCKMLYFYEKLCRLSLSFKGAVRIVAAANTERIALYYLLLLVIICFMIRRSRHDGRTTGERFSIAVAAAVMLLVFITVHGTEGLTIKMLDIGQGDTIFITCDGMTVLVDAGSSSKKEIESSTIFPFLKANGVQRLDYLILTHSDSDHISGAADLMRETINHKSYVKNLVLQDISEEVKDEAYVELVQEAVKNGVNIIYCSRGMTISNRSIDLRCIWPMKGASGWDKNTLSLVFELQMKQQPHFRMLFTGDLSEEGERELIKLGTDLSKTDVLKVGHHGSKTSSCEEFLALLRPKVALISCGENNRYGHPAETTLNRLRETGSHIYITAQSGQITLSPRRKKIIVETFLR